MPDFNELKVTGAFSISVERHTDCRGFFSELFSVRKYGPQEWRQINCSESYRNVVRGIHRGNYPKLCTCVRGRIFDVVVDLREESPTYLSWDGVWLTEDNNTQIYIPERCGHGFFAADERNLLVYFQGGEYVPGDQIETHWLDPDIGIMWPELKENCILSEKDNSAPLWRDARPLDGN